VTDIINFCCPSALQTSVSEGLGSPKAEDSNLLQRVVPRHKAVFVICDWRDFKSEGAFRGRTKSAVLDCRGGRIASQARVQLCLSPMLSVCYRQFAIAWQFADNRFRRLP